VETESERLASFIKDTIRIPNKELAEALGTSVANVSRYASLKPENTRPIPRDILCKLRKLYGLDLNWLITGESGTFPLVSVPFCVWKEDSLQPSEKLQKQGEITVPLSVLGNYRPQYLNAIRIEDAEYTVVGMRAGDIVIFSPADDSKIKRTGCEGNYFISLIRKPYDCPRVEEVFATSLKFTMHHNIQLYTSKGFDENPVNNMYVTIIGELVACLHTFRSN
jgi:transcriptional regulator with XRE-family HTH domain